MKTKRFLSFVTALTMTVSTFVSVHTVSAAQAEEDILTWDEIKTYVETTSPLVLGGSIYTDETGKYYYTGYGEKPTYVENGDYFILKSTAPGNKSAKHAFNIPSEEQISAGNVHLEYEINVPSMTSSETPATNNKFNQWGTLLGQSFDSGVIFDYYKGESSPAYFDIQKGKMKSGNVSLIKPTVSADTWFKVTTDVDYNSKTAVLKLFDSASGTQVGSNQSFVLMDDATYLKDIYMSFHGEEVKIRNIRASVMKNVKKEVTECSVNNGDTNVDVSAIILTMNEEIAKSDLENLTATDASGNTYSTYSAVNGNKAQVSVIGAKKNTVYTLSLPENDTTKAFSVSFTSGNDLYSYKWSSIGGNADCVVQTSTWGGTFTETDEYVKLLNKGVFNFAAEKSIGEDKIVVVEYDEYIPAYLNDDETKPIDTARYNTYDRIVFDNDSYLSRDLWSTVFFEEFDTWHHVVWTYNFSTKSVILTIDGKSYTADKSGEVANAQYVKEIRFQSGGSSVNKEKHIKNITVKRVDGAWKNSWTYGETSLEHDEYGIVTIKDNNTAKVSDSNKNIWTYSLAEAVTDMQLKVSYDFCANDALVNSTLPEVRFYAGADLNTKGAMMISYPYSAPEVRWAGGFKFNMPESYEANQWHKAEYVFDIDSTNGLTLKYVSIDGVPTLASYPKTNMTSIGCIEFWTYPDASVGEYELKIKNLSFEKNYAGEAVVVTANIENEAENVLPNNIELNFSTPVTDSSMENIMIYDEDGELVEGYSVALDDTKTKATVKMDSYELGAMYTIEIAKGGLEGYLGGMLRETWELVFFTSESEELTGKWVESWKINGSSCTTADGITTLTAVNSGVTGAQNTRDSWAYSFSAPVTGTDVPLTISYKFKANEALTKSEGSNIRFYPKEHSGKGGTSICVDFPVTNPQFRWDNIKFNLPEGVTSLAADTWHDVKFVFNVDSVKGNTLEYVVVDGITTYTDYNKAAMTQLQSIDFWFYSTAATTDNFELQIKDMKVIKGKVPEEVVKELRITDAEATSAEGNVSVKVQFSNTTDEVQSGKLIVAAYNSEGSLLSVGFKPVSVAVGDYEDTVTFEAPAGDYDVKVFMWDGFESMNALCNVISIPADAIF